MTNEMHLEQAYRRWLRFYPRWFRAEHDSEMLDVLLASAAPGRRRPDLGDRLNLVHGALCVRLRPRVSRSHRSILLAVRLLWLGAVMELALLVTIIATLSQVRSTVVTHVPGYTTAQWHAEVASAFDPLAYTAAGAVVFWVWMAWANGRGHRWAKVLFAAFFAQSTYSLLDGLIHGSATYARADLTIGLIVWLVEAITVMLLGYGEFRRLDAARRPAATPSPSALDDATS